MMFTTLSWESTMPRLKYTAIMRPEPKSRTTETEPKENKWRTLRRVGGDEPGSCGGLGGSGCGAGGLICA